MRLIRYSMIFCSGYPLRGFVFYRDAIGAEIAFRLLQDTSAPPLLLWRSSARSTATAARCRTPPPIPSPSLPVGCHRKPTTDCAIALNSLVETKTGRGHFRVMLSAVVPSKPVENSSLTPRWPITTRSATLARSQISFGDQPHVEKSLVANIILGASLAEIIENHFAALSRISRILVEKSR